ncbi:hypothetical protein GCM10008905_24280 [Clostridium malenominatum]|uniref:Bacterial membrane protein YfhO n=1 Tax=Clostridium malenominatum TaxID=1539 RepID=A0ABP3U8Q6_9CLOT
MNKHFIRIKSNLIIKLILIIIINFIAVAKLPNENIRLEVDFSGKYDNSVAQIFFDLGKGYSEENSFKGIVNNDKVIINIPSKYFEAIQIRFDPINISENVIIKNIKLFKYRKELLNWNGKDIAKQIERTNNIKDIRVVDNSIQLIDETEDMQIIFNHDATKEFKSVANYNLNKIGILLVIDFFAFFILLLVDLIISRYTNGKILETLNRDLENKLKKYNKFMPLIILLVIIIPAIILYWKYIIFEKIYVFNDIGSDSYFQTFPGMIYNAKYIYKYKSIPMWSFNVGLGQNFFTQYLDPFNLLIALFGENLVTYLLGLFQFTKVILAGVLFYKYLRVMEISRYPSIISALGYAFCGQIIARGSWVGYPNEVVCVAFLLYSFEMFYKKNNFKWLPIAILFLIITLKGYYFFLYSGILMVYAIFRYLSENNFSAKSFIKFVAWILMLYTIGVLLSSIYLIPNLVFNFTGARVSNLSFDFNNLIKSIFTINSNSELITSYARTVSHGLLGISKYSGSGNLLEGPLYYCGLTTLILIPQIFNDLDKKKKIFFGGALGIAILYILSPGIRYIASGMVTMQFKVSSFWIMVVFLYLSSYSLNEIINGKKINTRLLLFTIILILSPLGLLYFVKYQGLEITELIKVVILVLFYYMLFLGIKKYKYVSEVMILSLTIIEVIVLSYPIVNDRGTIEKDYINNKGYYDSTNEVVKRLNEEENNGFYRISKNYNSVFLCDSLIQGYYGTQSYQGGSSHSKYITNFINDINAPLVLGSNSYINGFSGYTQVNTMLGVKYILSRTNEISEYGYERIPEDDGIIVLKNKYSLPLGYAYSNYITYDDFKQLTVEQKRDVLLEACVVNKDNDTIHKLNTFNYGINKEKLREENIVKTLDKYRNGEEVVINTNERNDLITISFDINKSSDNVKLDNNQFFGKIYWAVDGQKYNTNNMITFGVDINNPNHTFDINQKDIKRIKLEMSNTNDINISNFKISSMIGEDYYEEYRNNVLELKRNQLKVTSFGQNNIQGNIELNESKMMFLSIPYDKGWSLNVDGNPVELENINVGFMGAYIKEGYHNIELKYTPPGLKISIILSVFGITLYMLTMFILNKEIKLLR